MKNNSAVALNTQNKLPVSDVVTQNVEVLEVLTDASRYTRLGWFIVLFGVVGFIVWASFAPLDQGVPLGGTVAVSSNKKMVQHQTGGIVDQVLVKDGDIVKAGQVLVEMNNVTAKSNAEVTRGQLYSAKASEARLIAERDNASKVTFPADLEKNRLDSRVANVLQLQQQLFSARTGSLRDELGALEENMEGLKSQLTGLQASMLSKKQQQLFLKEQLDGMRELDKEGYIARNRLLEVERTYAQVNSSISEDLGNIGRVIRQISELKLRKSQRTQDYQKEVRTQLSEIQKEQEALSSRMVALDFELSNSQIKASADGTVIGLVVFTKGAVIPAGFKLMEIVPSNDELIIEGLLPVNLVDKVHAGLKTDFVFSAFNTHTTPHIPGKITYVSADRTLDERTGQAFYKVHAAVTPEGMKLLKDLQVRPGMPVEMVVKTGERSMMNYLLKPILDRANTALTEE